MIGRVGFFALAVVVLPSMVRGDEVQTVVVTSEPETGPEGIAPTTFATVIETDQHAAEIETVTEALAESVGIQVRRYGGLGAFSTVSIRGSASNQVQIYLDGIPLSRAQNESVNLADLPIDSLDRIEIYRGTVPVTFGVAGPGGVVNLITKDPSVEPTAEVSAAYGSYDTRKVVASYSQNIRGIGFLAHVTYLGSDGDFSFKQEPQGMPGASHSMTRVNNEFNGVNALFKASYSFDARTEIDATSEAFYKDQGVPGSVQSVQAHHVSFEEWRSLSYLRLNRRHFLVEGLDTSVAAFGGYQVQGLRDLEDETGLPRQDRDDATISVGTNATATYAVSPAHTGALFTELAHEKFTPRNDVQDHPKGPDQERLRWTLAFQDEAWLLPDVILLLPSIRYEHLDDDISGSAAPAGMLAGRDSVSRDLWGGGIGLQIKPLAWWTIKANVGHYERAPSFFELFGTSGGVIGNPELDPETAENRDIGFILAGDFLPAWVDTRFEYAYFDNRIDDLITLVASSTVFARPQNIGGAHIRGHELVHRTELFDHVALDLNFTHQKAKDRSGEQTFRGKELPFRPEDELYSRLEVYNDLGKLYYEFNFIGSNCLRRACLFDRDKVDERNIHSVGVAFNAADWLTMRFEVRNLSDNQIRDVANFPLPGRSVFSSVTAQF